MGIFTIIKSNFKHKKGSNISIVILMIIISLALSTILSVNNNISKRYDEAAKEIDLADLNYFIYDFKFSDEIINTIKNNKNVASVDKEDTIFADIKVNDKDYNNMTLIKKYDSSNFKYKVYNKNQTEFISNPKGLGESEAYVPVSFKDLFSCKVGDNIEVNLGNDIKKIKIKGFIEEPLVGSSTMGIKLFFIDDNSYNEIVANKVNDEDALMDEKKGHIVSGYTVSINKKQDSKLPMEKLKKEINKESQIGDKSTFSISKEHSKYYTEMFISIISSILYAFIILLFIVVLIVMGHSISSSLEMDYLNLGILKSQGFTKNNLKVIYLCQYLVLQIVGIIIGISLSTFICPYMSRIFSIMTGLLSSTKIDLLNVLGILSIIGVISTLFLVIKLRKLGKISPVNAISGGRDDIYFNDSLKLPISKKMLSITLAIRQVIFNKKQYISSLLIISILTFFIIAISSMNNLMTEESFEELFGGVMSNMDIKYNDSLDIKDEVEKKIENVSKIKDSFQIKNSYFTIDEEEICGQVMDDTKRFKSITEGRRPKYENEIIITKFVQELLDKNIGDKVKITYGNESKEYIISGYYQATIDAGIVFGMSTEGMKRLDKDYSNNCYDYVIEDESKINKIIDILEEDYGDKITVNNLLESDNTIEFIMIAVDAIIYIIYGLSILFVLVVSIMVCSRMFYKEKKELGIYKSQGFTTRYLRLLFSIRFFIVSVLGCLLGFVLDYLLDDKLMSSLLKGLGIYQYTTKYSIATTLIPCLVISICYFVFAYIISSKIKRVNVKELITE